MDSTTDQVRVLEFRFPAPGPPVGLNELYSGHSGHWAARERKLEPWRWAVWAELLQLRRSKRGGGPVGRRCRIEMTLPFATNRVRDPHNYIPTVKVAVDQMVRMGLFPDDSPEYVTVAEPTLVVGKEVVLRVVPL